MFRLKFPGTGVRAPLAGSQLFNERDFYKTFVRDLQQARQSFVIECPYITQRRFNWLYPVLSQAAGRSVGITVNTRDPACHDQPMCQQAADCIAVLHELGATVLYTGNLHRKLAMIDHEVLWEGSLNILSQSDSCEVIRRSVSPELVVQTLQFTGLDKWYNV